MLKPQMPNIPGVGAVTDTLDFVKNLWGSMSVPGINLPSMAAPTLSVDELDKKIADLKAVESWLNLNVSMLRGTIQALEVQRGTIATLKSMGATLANAVKQPGANEKTVLAAAPYASAFFAQPAVEPAPKAEVKPAPKPEPKIEAAAVPKAETPADPAVATAAAAMANPVAWWNMLQDQFKQAVTNAMSSEAAAKLSAASAGQVEKFGNAIAKNAPKPAAKPAATKSAAKKAPAKPKAVKKET
ncbi:PhaM family polyhydroxyalkanoate granule multifunctional regulatory protein [Massilia sp. CF038]|uniref:PhaM family polyhydroxyalkanoate granule multifunctional regulatory protein n=1 Tax=Massilia sp. CF038 TaxID=1881045 RepID=UPI000922FDDA|nr:PhaM family polyhydroxyalkanoate granule multifunctional regulatory protein [Massilia sp. CF038]SHH63665.1 hypothetical protein SAMN05428948_4748 [Massilia sp. CF038]